MVRLLPGVAFGALQTRRIVIGAFEAMAEWSRARVIRVIRVICVIRVALFRIRAGALIWLVRVLRARSSWGHGRLRCRAAAGHEEGEQYE
jgi:hypothetical protein